MTDSVVAPETPHLAMRPLRLTLTGALGYFLLAWGVTLLSEPFGRALIFFPSAGWALGFALVFGKRALPGLFLGVMCFELYQGYGPNGFNWHALPLNLLISSGSMLQAYTAAWVLKRALGVTGLSLLTVRNVSMLALLTPIVCVLSASVGVGSLLWLGRLPMAEFTKVWFYWWMGDVMGVLLATPVVLKWLLRSQVAWGQRRMILLPAIFLLMAVAFFLQIAIQRIEQDKEKNELTDYAQDVKLVISSNFKTYDESLKAMQRWYAMERNLSFDKFAYLTRLTLREHPELVAMSFNAYVRPEQRAGFEAQMSRKLGRPFEIKERNSEGRVGPAIDSLLPRVPVTYIAPLQDNLNSLGFDIASEGKRYAAIQRAIASGQTSITEPIQLVQDEQKVLAVLMLRPVYEMDDLSDAYKGEENLIGFAVMVIRIEQVLKTVLKNKFYKELVLSITAGKSSIEVFASHADSGPNLSQLVKLPVRVVDTEWNLLTSYSTDKSSNVFQNGGLENLVVLLASAVTQMLLLLATGRTLLIQNEVDNKTQALRERQAEIENAQKVAKLGSWALRSDGSAEASDEIKRMLGLLKTDGFDFNFMRSLVHPDDKKQFDADWHLSLERGHFAGTYRVIVQGQLKWIKVLASVDVDDAGNFRAATGIAQDVSELESSHDRLKSVMNSASDAIVILDPQGKLSYWNLAVQTLFAYGDDELNGRYFFECFKLKGDLEQLTNDLTVLLKTGSGPLARTSLELDMLMGDGSERSVELALSAVLQADGWNAVGILRDVTARKQVERELLHAKTAAEAADAAKTQFLAVMSHELRTPMNAVLGLLPHLTDSRLDDEQRRHVNTIMDASKGLMRTLNDILEFSSLQASSVTLEPEPFNLHVLLDSVKKLHQPSAIKKSLDLQFEVSSDLSDQYVGDSLRMSQVLNNLVGNAIKFTDKGVITVRALPVLVGADHGLRFEVTDCGIGLSEEQISRLFQPFTQAEDSSKRRFGGTGLGLSTCKQLVELMGGEIGVQSSLGQGSMFWFKLVLPVCDEAMPDQALTSLRGLSSAAPTGKSIEQLRVSLKAVAGARVLVIEDDEINQIVVQKALESLGMVVAHAADNGRLGFEYLAGCSGVGIDVVLMDLHMPVMNGLEATLAIRAAPWGKEIPIFAVTAAAFEKDRQASLQAGMNVFLSKPLEIDKLAMALLAHLPPRFVADASDPQDAPVERIKQAGTSAQDLPAGELALEGFDLTQLNFLCKTAPDELHGVLTEYGLNLLGWQTNWQQALAHDDVKSMKTLAHTLAGMAGMVGAHQTHQAARTLEKALRDAGQAPDALQQACLVEIKANMRVLMAQGFLHPEELS